MSSEQEQGNACRLLRNAAPYSKVSVSKPLMQRTDNKLHELFTMEYEKRLPQSWSDLTWQQLCDVWSAKIRYSGNADVARAAAMLALCRCSVTSATITAGDNGEPAYTLRAEDGTLYGITPRELSQMAKQAIPWFDFPYGDPGEPAVKDEQGHVTKEGRPPHRGYVGPMRDALSLADTEVTVGGACFALPQVACSNITWQQYRSLQTVAPQLFEEGVAQAIDLQAQFLAHCLVPEAAEPAKATDPFRPKHTFRYDVDRAEQTVPFWRAQMPAAPTLFHICFQCYQTALTYYASAYPLLFGSPDKSDAMRDALQGEVGTVNTVMKYAGYADQQQVYDSNLPFILDILNTMTKEAKEIEKINAKIKKK